MFNKIAGALGQAASQVAEAGGSVVGIRNGTEEPPFTVQRRVDAVEIRRYGARIAAETTIEADEESARNEGFRRLARYIFGGNTTKAKIAMTAPVAQQQSQKIAMTAPVAAQRNQTGEWVIRFFMPSEQTMDTLPTPNDDRVRLIEVPAESVAVLRFSGVASPEAVEAKTAELLASLQKAGIETTGAPVTWFYDPPWTLPFRRRNEVVVGVTV
ncbi:MAG TPA: heme-binding protein [Mycobacterium sp.]|nr:heme-binding protein [Mycobacterium sp.]HPZ93607.1 heme-binding protein [Mycobacterium sp.]HQE14900.1 heme-binding protein [Mycobacterium sp.]